MDHFAGLAGALALIGSGLALVMAMERRRWRAIKAAGYAGEIENPALYKLTESLFALSPREIRGTENGDGESWLVFIDTRDTERADLAMLAYRLNGDNRPKVVLIRSGRRIPKFIRRLEGGMFKWAEPIAAVELTGVSGTGWFAYKEPGRDIPPPIKEFLAAAVQIPHSSRLHGIAVMDHYLVIWTDAWRVTTLLTTARAVRMAFQAATD